MWKKKKVLITQFGTYHISYPLAKGVQKMYTKSANLWKNFIINCCFFITYRFTLESGIIIHYTSICYSISVVCLQKAV